MPREALCAKDAVIQVLWTIGRVGPFARHPYEYRTHDGLIVKFLAPDLSPNWLTAIMLCSDLAKQVLEKLSRELDIGIDETRLKSNYGILVAPLWAEIFWSKEGPLNGHMKAHQDTPETRRGTYLGRLDQLLISHRKYWQFSLAPFTKQTLYQRS